MKVRSQKQIQTSVCIVGSGPAGLLLSQLLANAKIPNIVIDTRDRTHIEGRVRAGVLEPGTVQALVDAGVGDRIVKEGLVHNGFELGFQTARHRVDLKRLTGSHVTVYGQTELTKDLFAKRFEGGGQFFFKVENVTLAELKSRRPIVRFRRDATEYEIQSDFIAGCDGFHGVTRKAIPDAAFKTFCREYPFSWLGVLVDQPPVSDELLYTNHENGLALCSMRSSTRSRYYLQCNATDAAMQWEDDRFWQELKARIGPEYAAKLRTGASIEKSVTKLRSFVVAPLRFGALFLAGDAAHIVPPTGAKGLNLAVSDVRLLAQGFSEFYANQDTRALDSYSQKALERIWRVEKFSWQMSNLLHQFPNHTTADKHAQQQDFDRLVNSESAMRRFAENYVGLQPE